MQLGWLPNLLLIQPINFSILSSSLKGVGQEGVQLRLVVLTVAGSSRGRDGSSSVLNLNVLLLDHLGQATESWLEEVPAAGVLLFLLGPDNLCVTRILLKLCPQRVEWERSKLLNSHDGDVLSVELLSLSDEIVVDLARAEHDLLALVGLDRSVGLWQNTLELGARQEFRHVRSDFAHLEHLLRCDDNQGLSEGTQHLSAEHVEVVGSSAAVHDLDVALLVEITLGLGDRAVKRVAHLEVALNSAGRVFRTVTVETVRKQHNETILDIPLGLARHDKLIDHDLGTVSEVTELRLPKSQSVG